MAQLDDCGNISKESRMSRLRTQLKDMEIAAWILEQRLKMGMSVTCLAMSLRVTRQQVQQLEKGKTSCLASDLATIAEVLQRPVQWVHPRERGVIKTQHPCHGMTKAQRRDSSL